MSVNITREIRPGVYEPLTVQNVVGSIPREHTYWQKINE